VTAEALPARRPEGLHAVNKFLTAAFNKTQPITGQQVIKQLLRPLEKSGIKHGDLEEKILTGMIH